MRSQVRLAASLLVLGSALAACANLPTSGTVQVKSLQGSGGQPQPGIQIVPVPPGRGWEPTDIVNGFLAASASFDNNFAVARKYLTTWFSHRWHPGLAATVIDVPNVNSNTAPKGLVPGAPQTKLVTVTGRHFEELQTAGPNQAGSIRAVRGSSTYRFSLIEKGGVWRIDAISLIGQPSRQSILLLTSADFARDYQTRDLYFYSGRLPGALVPDPVPIPQRPGNSGLEILVNSLLHAKSRTPAGKLTWTSAPPDSSWLYGAATTAFPTGTKLLSVDVVGGIKAVVNLGGTARQASQAQLHRMAAQLWWTLVNPPPFGPASANQIRSVVLQVGRRSLQPLGPNVAGLVPRGTAAPPYYQLRSGPEGPAAVVMRATPSQQAKVYLPEALGGQTFSTIAVSRPPIGSAVLAGCLGRHVYLMPQSRAGGIVTRLLPAGDCTSLSWDFLGNLWVGTTKGVFEIPALPSAGVMTVQIPPLPSQDIQSLRVAPDGARVALLVRSGSSTKILIAAISKIPTFTYLAQSGQMLRVGSDVTNPVALTWLDPDHLLVLDQTGAGKTEIWEVPLNSGNSTEIASPPGVTSLAARWPNPKVDAAGTPVDLQVIIGIAPSRTSPGGIEIDKSGLVNPDWVPLVKGITPVFPG